MSSSQPQFLSSEQLQELLSLLELNGSVKVVRIRPHNKGEIRSTVEMTGRALTELILTSVENEHLPGGELEVPLPGTSHNLIGHHDGLYWIEPRDA